MTHSIPRIATCPVCGKRQAGRPPFDPDEDWLSPEGWTWSCGEVGFVCSEACASIGSEFGLRPGNHRPNDDFLLLRREVEPEDAARIWNTPTA